MNSTSNFNYFQGNSFSELYAQDITDTGYGFILNYPATASWVTYPNTKKYLIQDGSSEATKTSYDKIYQKEPWKNLAVLGNSILAIVTNAPPKLLVDYWQEHFGFNYTNIEVMPQSDYLDKLNSECHHIHKLITLFPFDGLQPEKHAVVPDTHYHLLSKTTLNELGVQCPKYKSYNLQTLNLEDIELPQFPYLIKTSHGLSGEGTYIIKNASDLNYCLEELRKYLDIKQLSTIIVSEFIENVIENYCVQFYVSKTGQIILIGTTRQLVTSEGNYLGGLINYRYDTSKFFDMIAAIGEYAHSSGYFGVIGFDVLENQEGLYVIDANFRVNGSTPLCLQRHTLLNLGKEVAKFSSDYRMHGTLESILVNLKPELERRDLIILSALEKVKYGKIYTEIYGIVTGESIKEMQQIERKLREKGLQGVT